MKNIFKSLMLVAVAAMGFACQENVADFTPERANEVVMTITADVDETRTYISEENDTNGKVAWSEGDQIKVIENGAIFRTSDAAVIDGDGKAQFAVSFPKNDGAVTYNAVFPASAVVEEAEVNADEVQVAVKSFQYPTATSFDPQADVLVAKELEFDAQPEALNMQFKRIVSLGKMTLKKIEDDAKISKVIFTVENQGLAGRNTVNTTTGEVVSYGNVNTITLTYAEPIATREIYFTCNPFKLVADDTFKVTVVCADNTAYVRKVTLAGDKELTFTEGDMSTFSVTMEKVDTQTVSGWNLVKDVNDLAVGDQIIIAAKGFNYALSTTQNGNNRAQAEITKSDDTVTFDDNVQIITLAQSSYDGLFGFYTGSGYLYAASSSSNHLKTKDTLDNHGSWKITIDDSGIATIKASQSSNRNWLRYNSTNNPPIFSCYSSGQVDIVIYKYTETVSGGDIEILPEPSFSVDVKSVEFAAEGGEETITVTPENNFYGAVTATTDAEWLTIKNDDYTFTITAEENANNSPRNATITFSAQDCNDVTVAVKQLPTAPVAGSKLTIAEFITLGEVDIEYILTGVISNVVNEDYGNFDITDESGKIYVYGIYDDNGNKVFTSKNLREGDTITLKGKYKNYNGTHEVVNAVYISHIAKPYIKEIEDIYVDNDATDATFNVSSNIAWSVSCDNTDWVTSYTESGENDGTIVVAMQANETSEARFATFTLTGEGVDPVSVKLTQRAKPSSTVEAKKTYTLQFGSSYNSAKISAYDKTWSATCGGFTWNIANANNNNNGWNYIKMGRNGKASVGTITTETVMPETIKTVTMTVDAVTTSKINSIKLYVANNSSFSNAEEISVTPAKGDLTFNIQNPTANCFYKIEVDCASGSSNGLITISKVVYTNK